MKTRSYFRLGEFQPFLSGSVKKRKMKSRIIMLHCVTFIVGTYFIVEADRLKLSCEIKNVYELQQHELKYCPLLFSN